MVTLQDLFKVLSHPQSLHAACVHAPIILAMVGALLCTLALVTKGRNATIQVAACVCLAIVMASALVAANAGEKAFAQMGDVPAIARQTAATHRWMAERVWLLALLSLGAAALALSPRPRVALAGRGLAAVLACGLAAWVGLTAHHGGTLVYEHGVGLPPKAPSQAASPQTEIEVDPRLAFFDSDVRPLLMHNCMSCHGPAEFAANGLSLTSPLGALKGGKRGPSIVAGHPEASLLLRAVRGEGMQRMPYNQPPLTAAQIAILERWIRDGAVWH